MSLILNQSVASDRLIAGESGFHLALLSMSIVNMTWPQYRTGPPAENFLEQSGWMAPPVEEDRKICDPGNG
jgi:hypothetical protein